MSGEDDNSRENGAERYGLRQFVVSSSQAKLGSNSPSLDGPAPLGYQCKVIGEKSIMAQDYLGQLGWKINFDLS